MVVPWCIKNITVDTNKLFFIMIIVLLIAWVPMIFSTPYILAYMRRRQNRKDWNEITNFEDHIIYDHGQELKAWYALTSYIDSFEDNEIPEYYGETHGRKIESKSVNPNELMKQPKKMFWIILAIFSVIAIAFAFALKAARKRQKR